MKLLKLPSKKANVLLALLATVTFGGQATAQSGPQGGNGQATSSGLIETKGSVFDSL